MYTIGIDYGTESGRALLVDAQDGREVATAVYPYKNGVIDEHLPGCSKPLPPDWALQDPHDYLDVLRVTIPAVLQQSGVSPEEVAGIAIDFTACTILPVKRDGTPLCFLDQWRDNSHAWVKLWKHHAAQGQANRINDVARQRGEFWQDPRSRPRSARPCTRQRRWGNCRVEWYSRYPRIAPCTIGSTPIIRYSTTILGAGRMM